MEEIEQLTFEKLFGVRTLQTIGKRRHIHTLQNAQWITTTKHTAVGMYVYAAGSRYKFFESRDAGWIIFESNSKTPNGMVPGRFFHRY